MVWQCEVVTREYGDHGRDHRGLATLDFEGAQEAPHPAERNRDLPRRAPEPFPRPLSSNGLRSQDGPLVARHHVSLRPARGRSQGGRLSRFVAAYGWRAFVIPVLAVVTFATLLDMATNGTSPASAVAQAPAQVTEPDPGQTQAPVTAEGESAPETTPAAVGSPPFVEQGTGQLTVVPGTSQVYGTGPLQRFMVELEDGIDVDPAGFAAAVELTLADPRSWGAGGRMSFQRVDRGDYDFRVSLVSPGSMETFCPSVGTEGYTSCRYGERAVINLARWETAVPGYAGDVETYRQYVINHEVGHALGHGHEQCPGEGELAPVMQQQTLGLDGCVKNPWPFPDA